MMSILGDRNFAQRKNSSVDLTKIPAPEFDLAMTLDSGQVFHWEKVGDGFVGAIGERAVYVKQRGGILQIKMEGGALRRHGENQIRQKPPRPTTAARAGSPAAAGKLKLVPPSAAKVVTHYFA